MKQTTKGFTPDVADAPPETKKPVISIVDRRLRAGSIFASASIAIPAKEPGRWTFREVNTRIADDHLWTMLHKKFWVYASAGDLDCEPGAFAYRELDGKLVKGVHGDIILMKQPLEDYQAVQQEKDRTNRTLTFGDAKKAIVSAASREPGGDRGADLITRQLGSLNVTDSVERVSLED